jgi:hypothetical protein
MAQSVVPMSNTIASGFAAGRNPMAANAPGIEFRAGGRYFATENASGEAAGSHGRRPTIPTAQGINS